MKAAIPMSKGPPPSVEELVQVLRRTSLPTIICEGPHDIAVYREIERTIGVTKVSVMAAGGRVALLQLHARRSEYQRTKTVFFADSDMWMFVGVPIEHAGVHFTAGCSLENELFQSLEVEALLNGSEIGIYTRALDEVTRWFAFVVNQVRSGSHWKLGTAWEVLDPSFRLCPNYCSAINYVSPSDDDVRAIRDNYQHFLRGKTWLEVLTRLLGEGRRTGAKFSSASLRELGCKFWAKEFMERQTAVVRAALT